MKHEVWHEKLVKTLNITKIKKVKLSPEGFEDRVAPWYKTFLAKLFGERIEIPNQDGNFTFIIIAYKWRGRCYLDDIRFDAGIEA